MDEIPQEFTLTGAVSYWNVDRDNLLTLRSLFAFLQEAAIKHAEKFDWDRITEQWQELLELAVVRHNTHRGKRVSRIA